MITNTNILGKIYYGPIASRLDFARDVHARCAPEFLRNMTLQADLAILKKYASALSDHMGKMELGSVCVSCSKEPSGGCCSLFMAGETDAIQILINLLAGVTVSQVRDDGVECCFLDKSGCLFLFKPMFCLNYICQRIHTGASEQERKHLEFLTGQLLSKQYEMENKLLDLL